MYEGFGTEKKKKYMCISTSERPSLNSEQPYNPKKFKFAFHLKRFKSIWIR